MNTQKFTNLFGNSKTNWGYILILVILAFFVIGGIFSYQWWISIHEVELPEVQTILKEHPIPQKIILTSDKTEYERDDIVKYTIINNSSSAIFPILSEGIRLIELQKYNYDSKEWEPPKDYELMNDLLVGYHGYFPVFSVSSKNPVSPISILGKEENDLPLNKILNQFNDSLENYRLVFLYYDSNSCYENSFWGNPECGEAESSSWLNDNWEVIKIVISNEFTVKGTTLAEAATARSFCLERYKENDSYSEPWLKPYLESVVFLNFDIDEDKEIITLCWDGAYAEKQGLLFVLDKQNNQWKSVWEKEGSIAQRYYTFENLTIKDIDKDGIDEIIYEERGWYLAGGNSYLHLYSPKHQEWFYRNNWWDKTTGVRKEGVKLSPNLDLEKYKLFKEFILEM